MGISVIVPVYNGCQTLAGCLASLMALEGGPHEVIVVDDGSTDDSAEIAGRFACQVIRLPANGGAAEAKNVGAEAATGDVLFFTDADCHVHPRALTYVGEVLGDPQVDGVVGLLAEACPYGNFASQFKNLWMHYTYRRQPRRVGLFFTSAAAIRRELFLREGGFDAHYRGASITEDIEFGQRLLSKGYTIIMDQRLTVEHQKHYSARQVLRTDLLRARGLVATFVRNRVSGERRAHYASVPWYFGAGVGALGLATLLLAVGLLTTTPWAVWSSLLLALAALALNAPFLLALARWRGGWFLIQSALFLWLDLLASGLGIVWGLADFAAGRRY